jgi:hypothetical protein
MYNNIYIEKTKDDGTKLEIRVLFMDGKFRIDEIGVKPKGKRKFTYLGTSISNDYSYRGLNMEERLKFKFKKFIEVCSIELLNEALQEAWLSIKPEELKSEEG